MPTWSGFLQGLHESIPASIDTYKSSTSGHPEAVTPVFAPVEMSYLSCPTSSVLLTASYNTSFSLLLRPNIICPILKCWESLEEMSTWQKLRFDGKQLEVPTMALGSKWALSATVRPQLCLVSDGHSNLWAADGLSMLILNLVLVLLNVLFLLFRRHSYSIPSGCAREFEEFCCSPSPWKLH